MSSRGFAERRQDEIGVLQEIWPDLTADTPPPVWGKTTTTLTVSDPTPSAPGHHHQHSTHLDPHAAPPAPCHG